MAKGKPSPGSAKCPLCSTLMAPRKIHEHTSQCALWLAAYGKPWPHFTYSAWNERTVSLFASSAVEGVDYMRCQLCWGHGWDFRFSRMIDHVKLHGITEQEYLAHFPDAKVRLDKTTEVRKASVREKYGVDFIGQSETAKEKSKQTSLEKYGVEYSALDPEIRARQLATNRERYGAENPFASPEIQEKIRQKHLAVRGVENPGQDPAVMAKRIGTNQERYGTDHYLETDEFQEKSKAASQARFGTDHPMQSEEGRALLAVTMQANHGVDFPFQSEDIQQRAYDANLANHGGKHSQQCPEVLDKARATWMEKYGEDNPSKVEAVKERIKEVWMGKYGVPFPPQSLWTNREQSFPNGLERAVDALSPECVVYAGDGSYWVRHKGVSRARNPDFVVFDRAQTKLYQEGAKLNSLRTSAVIEAFGDFWHGPAKTGKEREVHKSEVEQYYARAGIVCLVLWESEVKQHPKRVGERIQNFLLEWRRGEYTDVKSHPDGDILDLFG